MTQRPSGIIDFYLDLLLNVSISDLAQTVY